MQVLQVQQVIHVIALDLLAPLGQTYSPRLARELPGKKLAQVALTLLLLLLLLLLLAEAGDVNPKKLQLLQVCLKHRLLQLTRLQLLLLLLERLDHGGGLLGGHRDRDGGNHRVLGLQLGGRARLGNCVGAVAKACRAGQAEWLEAAKDGGAVVEHTGLLQHQQLSQRPARALPLGNVHR